MRYCVRHGNGRAVHIAGAQLPGDTGQARGEEKRFDAPLLLTDAMSEKIGPISILAPQEDGLPPVFQRQPYSEATSELIDDEIRRIVEQSHREADRLLGLHREQLDAIARALLESEALNAEEIRAITGLPAVA